MALILNLNSLIAKLRAKAAEAMKASDAKVTVGFTAGYAVYVHENLNQVLRGQPRPSGIGTYWSPGQPKFLEQPARELSNDGTLSRMVFQALKAKQTMAQALVQAGLRLQRESQALVPVEYSLLKASAFTRLDHE